eukprot:m.30631 g.30631  ORF g.30631 m.30631 type:complete len:460 (+) comp8220_c0_seq1:131-1510(+)
MDEREERYIPAWKGVHSTGGAVPVVNDKGEVSMEKVKVKRYRAGERPDYASEDNSSSTDDEEDQITSLVYQRKQQKKKTIAVDIKPEQAAADRRLQRLKQLSVSDNKPQRARRQREVIEAVVEEDEEENKPEAIHEHDKHRVNENKEQPEEDEESSEDEDEIENRRKRARQRALERQKIQPVVEELEVQEEDKKEEEEGSGEESSEWETETESEDDTPMLKPVFVSKSQRLTVLEREAEEAKAQAKYEEEEAKWEKRRDESRAILAKTMQAELDAETSKLLTENDIDDEDEHYNEEEEFAAWKVRELKRIKRDQEKRAQQEAEKLEIERLRDLDEEARLKELQKRERVITNKKEKGKMKFMQKYYHRGAFFLDKEEDVLKRDVSAPTLEDHFDKQVMPKVMQVKNFGKMSRTKYTHLVDQDTSTKDSPWSQIPKPMESKLESKRAGAKPVFDRPSKRKR